MSLRLSPRALILSAALVAAAGCGSVEGAMVGPRGRAVVIHAADRADDARAIGERLAELGLVVALEHEGPPVRERSSVAVYRAASEDSLVDPAREALGDWPELEWLPSVHAGPPLTDVVVWLVSRDREAAAAD